MWPSGMPIKFDYRYTYVYYLVLVSTIWYCLQLTNAPPMFSPSRAILRSQPKIMPYAYYMYIFTTFGGQPKRAFTFSGSVITSHTELSSSVVFLFPGEVFCLYPTFCGATPVPYLTSGHVVCLCIRAHKPLRFSIHLQNTESCSFKQILSVKKQSGLEFHAAQLR